MARLSPNLMPLAPTVGPHPRSEPAASKKSHQKRFGQLLNLSSDFLSFSPPPITTAPSSPVGPLLLNSPTSDTDEHVQILAFPALSSSSSSAASSPASTPSLASPTLSTDREEEEEEEEEEEDGVSVSEFPLPPGCTKPFELPRDGGNRTLAEVRAHCAFWRGFGDVHAEFEAALFDEMSPPHKVDAAQPSRAWVEEDYSWEAEPHRPASDGREDVALALQGLREAMSDDDDDEDNGILDALVELSMSMHTRSASASPTNDDHASYDALLAASGVPQIAYAITTDEVDGSAHRAPVRSPPPTQDVSSEWIDVANASYTTPPPPRPPPPASTSSRPSTPASSSRLAPSLSMPDLKHKARELKKKTSSFFGGGGGSSSGADKEKRRHQREPTPPLPMQAAPALLPRASASPPSLSGRKDMHRLLGSPTRGVAPPLPRVPSVETLGRYETSAAAVAPSPSKKRVPPPLALHASSQTELPSTPSPALRTKKSLPTLPWTTYAPPSSSPPPTLPPPSPSALSPSFASAWPSGGAPSRTRAAPIVPSSAPAAAAAGRTPSTTSTRAFPTVVVDKAAEYETPRSAPPVPPLSPAYQHGRSVSTGAPVFLRLQSASVLPRAGAPPAAGMRTRRTGSDVGPVRPVGVPTTPTALVGGRAGEKEGRRDLLKRAVGRAGVVGWWKSQGSPPPPAPRELEPAIGMAL